MINVLLESNIDRSRIVYAETHAKENIPFITNKYVSNLSGKSDLQLSEINLKVQCNTPN